MAEKTSQTPLLIIGTGVEARTALEIANQLDVLVLAFVTEDADELNQEINDILILAELGSKDSETLLKDDNVKIVVTASNGEDRRDLVDQIRDRKAQFVNLIHPSSQISEFAKLDLGAMVGAQSVIAPNTKVGEFTYIGTQVSVGVQAEIGEYCTIQDGVTIGAEVVIDDDVFIGHGAVIHPGVKIGHQAMVAAGAVVMQNVPDDISVFGNPAKPV